MKNAVAAGMIALLLAAAAQDGAAQVRFGVAGGPSTPAGGLADFVDAGFHGGGVMELGLPLLPVGVRADLMFQRLPGAAGGPAFDQVFGTVNARLGLLPVPLLSVYATGGAGLYSSTFHADTGVDDGRTTEPGINLGVGASVNLLFVRPFVEARYHRLLSDPARAFIPISVGVYF